MVHCYQMETMKAFEQRKKNFDDFITQHLKMLTQTKQKIVCPKDHELKQYFKLTPRINVIDSKLIILRCNVCTKIIDITIGYWSCGTDTCDWDCCKGCYQVKKMKNNVPFTGLEESKIEQN